MAGYIIEKEESDREMRLCAGLSYVGERELDESERSALGRESNIHMAKALFFALCAPALIILFPLTIWHEHLIRAVVPHIGAYVIGVSLIACVFGLPLAILLSRDYFRKEEVLGRAAESGNIRCFEGQLNIDDRTDAVRTFLTKRGFLKTADLSVNRIELFGNDDVVYMTNGNRPPRFLEVELTSAALPDPSTPYFSVPPAWKDADLEVNLERRRLSEGEIEEVRSYAKENWRYVRFLFLFGILVFGMTEIFTLGLFEMEPYRSHVVSVSCAIAICVAIFYRRKGRAERLEKDAENGWAFMCHPPGYAQENSGEAGPEAPVEFLPLSNVFWTIDGKPAGWRRKSTE